MVGGITQHGIIHNAAAIAIWGMDPVVYLTTTDDTLRVVMQAVSQKADEFDKDLGERRAIQISNAVAKAFGGG